MKLADFKEKDPEICLCKHITRSQMEEAIRNGADTIPKLRDTLLGGRCCGGCGELMDELIELVKSQNENA